MNKSAVAFALVLASFHASAARAQHHTYPAIGEYMMPRDAETALAKSAAPPHIPVDDTLAITSQQR